MIAHVAVRGIVEQSFGTFYLGFLHAAQFHRPHRAFGFGDKEDVLHRSDATCRGMGVAELVGGLLRTFGQDIFQFGHIQFAVDGGNGFPD